MRQGQSLQGVSPAASMSKATQLLLQWKRATAGLAQPLKTAFSQGPQKILYLFSVSVKPYSGEKKKSYSQTSKNNWENGCLDFQALLFLYFPLLKNPK